MSSVPAIPWHRPMSGRDPDEDHRASTPLELFFDLCFVVAVAAAAATLHHDLAHDHLSGIAGYLMVFFAIWWAWLNYSWFASAYDCDDIQFRLLTFVVMSGVLVLAAGVPRAAGEEHDFWLRGRRLRDHALGDDPAVAARGPGAPGRSSYGAEVRRSSRGHPGALDPAHGLARARRDRLRLVHRPRARGDGGAVLGGARRLGTPWHRHHIAERYELFTIIVLGEVILATTQAISSTLDDHGLSAQLVLLILGSLITVFSMWWIYFKRPMVDSLRRGTAFLFGYVHGFVFASVAAVGACLAVLVDIIQEESHLGDPDRGDAARGIRERLHAGALRAAQPRGPASSPRSCPPSSWSPRCGSSRCSGSRPAPACC